MKEILLIVGPAALAIIVIAILVTWLIVKTRSLNALRESEAGPMNGPWSSCGPRMMRRCSSRFPPSGPR